MRRSALIVAVSLAAVILLISVCQAKVVYVKYDSPTNGPGSSWSNAYHKVSDAVTSGGLVANDQVWVARGVYNETFRVNDGIAFYGGFAGTETTVGGRAAFPRPELDPNETVLDGTGLDSSVVRIAENSSSTTRLDGFTVRNGIGIYNKDSDRSYGGGILVYHSSAAWIANNRIVDNTCDKGGGIYINYGCSVTVYRNIICDNTVFTFHGYPDQDNGHGAGIYVFNCYGSAVPTISNNIFRSNIATHRGGAILCYDSDPVVFSNIFEGNAAGSPEGFEWYGGGIYCKNSDPSIINNTFCGNGALNGGGALYFDLSSYPRVYNNIIYASSGNAIVKETGAGVPVLSHNDVTDGYVGLSPGDGDINVDPQFMDLENRNYHLRSTSPCVDTGGTAPDVTGTDIDGDFRILGVRVDIGADEYNAGFPPLPYNLPAVRTEVPSTYSFEVVSEKWAAVGIKPTSDHDIQASTDSSMLHVYQSSASGGSAPDIIVVNGHSYGNCTHYAQVYYGSPGEYIIEAENAATEVALGTPVSRSFPATSVFDLYEASLIAGVQYTALADISISGLYLNLYVYYPSRANGKIGYADQTSASAGTPVTFTAPETGTYAFLVVRTSGSGGYTFGVTGPTTISGTVKDFGGAAMGSVIVTANPGGYTGTTSALTGNYTITVPSLWSGTVTPAKGKTTGFIPGSRDVPSVTSGATADFRGGKLTSSIGAAKKQLDGISVLVPGVVWTAAFGNNRYVEELDRSAGILAIVRPYGYQTKVNVGGVLATVNGERRLNSAMFYQIGTGSVAPLHVTNKDLGGSDVTGGAGVSNVGELVRTEGLVTGVYADGFTIDDGSSVSDYPGRVGVTVSTATGMVVPAVGDRVTVTGISSLGLNGTSTYRLVKPRGPDDVSSSRVVYVSGFSDVSAGTIQSILNSSGMPTTVVYEGDLTSANLDGCSAIVISAHSHVADDPAKVQTILNSGKPVVGIGSPGANYFGAIGLAITKGSSMLLQGDMTVVPQVLTSPIFLKPYDLSMYMEILVYSGIVQSFGVYRPLLTGGSVGLASYLYPWDSYYPIAVQGRNVMWGSDEPASKLTLDGQRLLVNTVWYAAGL